MDCLVTNLNTYPDCQWENMHENLNIFHTKVCNDNNEMNYNKANDKEISAHVTNNSHLDQFKMEGVNYHCNQHFR